MSSDPPLSRSPLPILDPQQPPPPPPPPPLSLSREYRKGNWTVHETLILITAKRLDDDRRTRSTSFSSPTRSAEQRWKWVENYCWKQGCHRSQNQCNDKWDNLLRDYKKVRDYQSRPPPISYWSLDRHDRKHRNLPTNLSLEVFDALTDVLNRRASLRTPASIPPPPPPPQQASISGTAFGSGEMTPEGSSETEGTSEMAGGKRRRGIGSSVVRGAEELARAMMACEERKERRHRDLMELEERRLRMEESRTEMNRQSVAGLIAAVSGLSAAIHSLVADHRGGHGR